MHLLLPGSCFKPAVVALFGIILLIASVSCLFLALQEAGVRVPWSSSKHIGLLVGFGILLAIFEAWQWKAGDNANIPFPYLKDRTVIWGSIYLSWEKWPLI